MISVCSQIELWRLSLGPKVLNRLWQLLRLGTKGVDTSIRWNNSLARLSLDATTLVRVRSTFGFKIESTKSTRFVRFLRRWDCRVDCWHDQFQFWPLRCRSTWCIRWLFPACILTHLLDLVLEGWLVSHHLLQLGRVSILGTFLKAEEGLLYGCEYGQNLSLSNKSICSSFHCSSLSRVGDNVETRLVEFSTVGSIRDPL